MTDAYKANAVEICNVYIGIRIFTWINWISNCHSSLPTIYTGRVSAIAAYGCRENAGKVGRTAPGEREKFFFNRAFNVAFFII